MKPEFRLKVAEWELRKALAGPSTNKVQVADIQKLMPDEFNRKLKEWELMKISSPGNARCGQIQVALTSHYPIISVVLAGPVVASFPKTT